MCNINDGFRLCTCAKDNPDISWVLERQDHNKSPCYLRGRAMSPHFSAKEILQNQYVCTALNDGKCFDFPYVRQEGDVLKLKIQDRWFRYRVVHNQWTVDTSTDLAGWRAQMVKDKYGIRKPL